jgi:hypothetical protein
VLNEAANTTAVNAAKFADIYSGVIESRGSSALWFYGAAGSTLLGLVILTLIQGLPRDKWEWGSLISRLIVGVGITCLSFLSLGSSTPVIDPNSPQLKFESKKIWTLNLVNWVLPILAIVLALLQAVEYMLVYLAYRAYFRTSPTAFPLPIYQSPQSTHFQPFSMPAPLQSPTVSSPYGIYTGRHDQPSPFDPYSQTLNSGNR